MGQLIANTKNLLWNDQLSIILLRELTKLDSDPLSINSELNFLPVLSDLLIHNWSRDQLAINIEQIIHNWFTCQLPVIWQVTQLMTKELRNQHDMVSELGTQQLSY